MRLRANIGAALAPLLCGWLGETYGWSYGFGAAGVGMFLGLVVLVLGVALLATDFYSDRLSGSKRTFFIVLLFAYAVYRSFRTYSLLKTRKTNEE